MRGIRGTNRAKKLGEKTFQKGKTTRTAGNKTG